MLSGSCHCGATKFEVASAPDTVTRCTCTICSKRGALGACCPKAELTLLTDRSSVASHRWQSMQVSHNFCPVCGCGTFTETPGWSTGKPDHDNPRIAVNARLFDEVDLDVVPVVVIDGRNLW